MSLRIKMAAVLLCRVARERCSLSECMCAHGGWCVWLEFVLGEKIAVVAAGRTCAGNSTVSFVFSVSSSTSIRVR